MTFTKTPWLARIRWVDGKYGYCRACDQRVPLRAEHDRLVCPADHSQHPLNVLAGRGFE